MSALGTGAIDRLKRTWEAVPPKSKNLLESMRQLMSGQRNYSAYREALANSVPPCIPFFGELDVTCLKGIEFTMIG